VGVYQYVIVQCVPDVVRDERVNVGLIARDPKTNDFSFCFLDRSEPLHALGADPAAASQVIRRLEDRLAEAKQERSDLGWMGYPGAPAFLERARAEFNGFLQLSEVRTMRGKDLDGFLEHAKGLLLGDRRGVFA
jgi:hypothetical protein